jgi:hypothetical protein
MNTRPAHDWRRQINLLTGDGIWDDADLLALPQDRQDAVEEACKQLDKALCEIIGHEPTRDHCGIPEHDFCLWCNTPLPGQWRLS